MPNNWIGRILLTGETEVSVGGEKVHDLIELNEVGGELSYVQSEVHPVLYDKIRGVEVYAAHRMAQCYRGGVNWEADLYNKATDRRSFSEFYDAGVNLDFHQSQYGNPVSGSSGTDAFLDSDVSKLGVKMSLYTYSKNRSGHNFVAKAGLQFIDATDTVVLEVLQVGNNNSYSTTILQPDVDPFYITGSLGATIVFDKDTDKVKVNGVEVASNIQFFSITKVKILCYTTSTSSPYTDTAIAWIKVSLPEFPNMTRPVGSPHPYKIIADKPVELPLDAVIFGGEGLDGVWSGGYYYYSSTNELTYLYPNPLAINWIYVEQTVDGSSYFYIQVDGEKPAGSTVVFKLLDESDAEVVDHVLEYSPYNSSEDYTKYLIDSYDVEYVANVIYNSIQAGTTLRLRTTYVE